MQLVVLISQTPPEHMCYCNLNNIVFAFVPMHLYSLPDDSPSFSLHHLPLAEQQRLQRLLDPLLRLVKRDGLGEPHQPVQSWRGKHSSSSESCSPGPGPRWRSSRRTWSPRRAQGRTPPSMLCRISLASALSCRRRCMVAQVGFSFSENTRSNIIETCNSEHRAHFSEMKCPRAVDCVLKRS